MPAPAQVTSGPSIPLAPSGLLRRARGLPGGALAAALLALSLAAGCNASTDAAPDPLEPDAAPAEPAADARPAPRPAPPDARSDAAGGGPDAGAGGADGAVRTGSDGAAPGTNGLAATPVFDPTKLHVVSITVDPQHLAALDNDQTKRVPCTFTFDGVTLAKVGIRKKGSIGSSAPLAGKPSFSFKFDEITDGQRLHGLKKLALNNAKQDPTFVREHVAYEVYRRAGLPGPLTAHAVVTFNGEVKGIYVVREAVDGDFLRRTFGKEYDQGNLYEPIDKADFAVDPEKAKIELKDEVEEMRNRDDLRALARTVRETPDADWEKEVARRLDLRAYVTSYAIDALAAHWDGPHIGMYGPNNYYLYHHPKDDRFVLVPHGMDQVFQSASYDLRTAPMAVTSKRLLAIPALSAQFDEAVQRVLREAWDVPALSARIDQAVAVVRAASLTGAAATDAAAMQAAVGGIKKNLGDRKARLLK
jgi:hypothetical protein